MIEKRKNTNKERGFTLLEYCAGAAMVMVVLFTAIGKVGTGADALLTNIGTRLTAEAAKIGGTTNK